MYFKDQEVYKQCFGIYLIKNIINEKCYVGQTSESFQRRFFHHRWKLVNNSHDNMYLQNSWNKHGEDSFVFEVVECIQDKNLLNDAEIKYIADYKSKDISYNMLWGGGGRRGFKMSESAKKLIGDQNRLHMIGKKHSEETKAKMSESRKCQLYHRNRVTTKINEDIARTIKQMLIKNIKSKDIVDELKVPYKVINGILSNGTWGDVIVDGWDDFFNNRKKAYRLKKEDHDKIRELRKNGMSTSDLATMYDKHVKTIEKILRS